MRPSTNRHPTRARPVLRRIAVRLAGFALLLCSCGSEPLDSRPSVLLVVIDTLRADAVSAYGAVERTTPHLDALAAAGLLYTRAYAPSPWTLPSHASIFTGLRIDQHGVGVQGRMGAPRELQTLAERLSAAGYQTAGFSENPLISAAFAMDQGFEHFSSITIGDVMRETDGGEKAQFDIVAEVAAFASSRDRVRPFFVFVNLFDPHSPYLDREVNRFLADGARTETAWTPQSLLRSPYRICDHLPPAEDIAILHGLYLGDAAAADAKLGQIMELVQRASGGGRLIAVVTSDHGEHFGEQRLLDHEFSVRAPVLNVPLAVHGLDLEPARIEVPVGLVDITPSILEWTGTEWAGTGTGWAGTGTESTGTQLTSDLAGRVLPTVSSEQAPETRDLFAFYADEPMRAPAHWGKGIEVQPGVTAAKRAGCAAEDRVFGNMAALTRWPFKLIWFQDYPAELYDLSWDPHERSDLVELKPEITAQLLEGARNFIGELGTRADTRGEAPALSADELEALRGLGYVE